MASNKDRKQVVIRPPCYEKTSFVANLMTKSVKGGYECPWKKFQRPGTLELLRWKMMSYDPIPCEEHYLEPPHRLKKAMEDRVLDPNKFVCLNIGEKWIVGDYREEPCFMKEKVKITT